MSQMTREQVMETISNIGVPLRNIFLVRENNGASGDIVIWNPEMGFRSIIIENGDLAAACYNYLTDTGSRRFESWDELSKASQSEKWDGWDTCADRRRHQEIAHELADKRSLMHHKT